MANPEPLNIPKPPDYNSNKKHEENFRDIHEHLRNLYIFMNTHFVSGSQAPYFSQSQLDHMVANNDLSQAGKLFMNNDTGKANFSEIVSGNLTMKEL